MCGAIEYATWYLWITVRIKLSVRNKWLLDQGLFCFFKERIQFHMSDKWIEVQSDLMSEKNFCLMWQLWKLRMSKHRAIHGGLHRWPAVLASSSSFPIPERAGGSITLLLCSAPNSVTHTISLQNLGSLTQNCETCSSGCHLTQKCYINQDCCSAQWALLSAHVWMRHTHEC